MEAPRTTSADWRGHPGLSLLFTKCGPVQLASQHLYRNCMRIGNTRSADRLRDLRQRPTGSVAAIERQTFSLRDAVAGRSGSAVRRDCECDEYRRYQFRPIYLALRQPCFRGSRFSNSAARISELCGRAGASACSVSQIEMVTQTSELVSSARARTRPEGITLCHFSVRHSTPKSRSFHMECLPLASSGADVRYVTPSSLNGHIDGVDFVPLPQRSSRLMRCVASFSLLAKLLRQRANVYHFQDPELLPVAFLLKLAFRKRILYDAYEDFPSLVLNKTAIPLPVRSIGARIVSALETLAANLFDGLMTADPFTLRRLARAGKSKKLVFYNFPNLNFFPT